MKTNEALLASLVISPTYMIIVLLMYIISENYFIKKTIHILIVITSDFVY